VRFAGLILQATRDHVLLPDTHLTGDEEKLSKLVVWSPAAKHRDLHESGSPKSLGPGNEFRQHPVMGRREARGLREIGEAKPRK
jgi:hypothetical protein